MLDAIAHAMPSVERMMTVQYELYHYTAGERDQEVMVVADIQDPYFAGIHTQDGKAVGVITGYCLTGGGVEEPECPRLGGRGPVTSARVLPRPEVKNVACCGRF